MDRTPFTDFDLKIEPVEVLDKDRVPKKLYRVSASSTCGGNATVDIAPDELEIDSAGDERQEGTAQSAKPGASGAEAFSLLQSSPPPPAQARSFGRRLFETVFKGKVGQALDRCLIATRKAGTPLRIRLNLTDVPELAGLPWEFLCLEAEDVFFARSRNSMVRYLDLNLPFDDSLLTEPPLRILAVVSNPSGVRELDVAGEVENLQSAVEEANLKRAAAKANLKNAVAELEHKGLIALDTLERPTLRALRQRLREAQNKNAPYHVFHFIGHAVFDHAARQGKLLLENVNGGVIYVSATELGEILREHPSLRLAVVNACEGARTSARDAYAGVAQTFLRSSAAPAVVAMQYKIGDPAAKIFSQSFYEVLLGGGDLDTAVAEARTSISDREIESQSRGGKHTEWATPVLYMRAKDSRLVEFPAAAVERAAETAAREPAREPSALDSHYEEVAKALLAGELVPFLGLDVNLYDPSAKPRPPAYAELVEHVTRLSSYPYTAGVPLAGVSQYAQLPNRLAKLYDHLAPLFDQRDYKPTPLHEFWARVAKERTRNRAGIDPKRRRFIVVATNYDELLERAFAEVVEDFHVFSYIADGPERGKFFRVFYEGGSPTEPVLVDDSTVLTDELPAILKLPGSVRAYNAKVRFAITEDQYFDLLTNKDLEGGLPTGLMAKLRGCHHLFLGYNVNDWNTRGMLYHIWEGQKPPYPPSWAVRESPSDFESKYWEACGVTVVDENLARYVAGLEAGLRRVGVVVAPTGGGTGDAQS